MRSKKLVWVLMSVCVCAGLGLMALSSDAMAEEAEDNTPPKNLQVLPKEMSRKDVTALMKTFNKQLGVKCKFCHDVKDYAADGNKHKELARRFMKLTEDMQARHMTYEGAPNLKYNCYVCHQGKPEPTLAPK